MVEQRQSKKDGTENQQAIAATPHLNSSRRQAGLRDVVAIKLLIRLDGAQRTYGECDVIAVNAQTERHHDENERRCREYDRE